MADAPTFLGDLCRTCEAIVAGLDYDRALEAVVTQVVRCLRAKASVLRLLDRAGRTLTPAASFGLSAEYLAKGTVEVGRSPIDREALEGRVVRVRDVTSDPRFQYPAEAAREGLRSLLCVPLRRGGRMLGVLRVYAGEDRGFDEQDEAFASVLASQSAAAVSNALRYRRMKSLNEIARTIVSRPEPAAVLDLICRSAAESVEADGSALYLLDRPGGRLTSAAACGPRGAALTGGALDSDPALAPCLRGEDVVFEAERPASAVPGEILPVRSFLCVPVRREALVVGALRVELGYPYVREEEDLEYLHTLGDFGLVALENARLQEHLRRDYEDLTRDVWAWYDWGLRSPRI